MGAAGRAIGRAADRTARPARVCRTRDDAPRNQRRPRPRAGRTASRRRHVLAGWVSRERRTTHRGRARRVMSSALWSTCGCDVARRDAGDREQLVERGPEAADQLPRVGNGVGVGEDAQVELVAVAPDGEVQRRAVGDLPGGEPAIDSPAAQVAAARAARHVGHDHVLERVEAALGPRVATGKRR